MRLRTLLRATAVGLGAVALANRQLRQPPDSLPTPFDRELQRYRWREFDIAYSEAGDPADPDLLLLHGINAAGSAHEFRHVFEALAERYHVVAPDMPGFGHSDRPAVAYDAALYEAFVADALTDLVERPTVVAASLSAAYLAGALGAADAPPIEEACLVCPTETAIPGRRPALNALVRAPLFGEAIFNLLGSRPSIRYFLADHGFADPASITDEWVAYDHAAAHQPGARYAPAAFLSGFLNASIDLEARLAALEVPVTILWGGQARLPPLERGRELAAAADATLVVLEDADLLPHAECPETVLDVLDEQLVGLA